MTTEHRIEVLEKSINDISDNVEWMKLNMPEIAKHTESSKETRQMFSGLDRRLEKIEDTFNPALIDEKFKRLNEMIDIHMKGIMERINEISKKTSPYTEEEMCNKFAEKKVETIVYGGVKIVLVTFVSVILAVIGWKIYT